MATKIIIVLLVLVITNVVTGFLLYKSVQYSKYQPVLMSFEREDGTRGMSDRAYTNGDIMPIDYVKLVS